MMQCSDKPVLLKAFNVFYLQTRSVDFIVLGFFFFYLFARKFKQYIFTDNNKAKSRRRGI